MNIKIEPRKTAERGGYLCMPLKRNIPAGKLGWTLTNCPECEEECWDIPLPKNYTEDMFTGKLCTMCGLKKGGNW